MPPCYRKRPRTWKNQPPDGPTRLSPIYSPRRPADPLAISPPPTPYTRSSISYTTSMSSPTLAPAPLPDTVAVTLVWPAVNVRDVIVTGDFDAWATHTHMAKPASLSPRNRSRTTSRAASPARTPSSPFAAALASFPFPPALNGREDPDAAGFPYYTLTLPADSPLARDGFEYKFFVDGVWQTSPRAPTRVDPSGKFVNNVWAPPKPAPVVEEDEEVEAEDNATVAVAVKVTDEKARTQLPPPPVTR
ncbi:hypothetical protein HWV62_36135 [Athelia sp. TMB]|nr:hypothetical protein HWV62_36135 [Athelia sp. TMB]